MNANPSPPNGSECIRGEVSSFEGDLASEISSSSSENEDIDPPLGDSSSLWEVDSSWIGVIDPDEEEDIFIPNRDQGDLFSRWEMEMTSPPERPYPADTRNMNIDQSILSIIEERERRHLAIPAVLAFPLHLIMGRSGEWRRLKCGCIAMELSDEKAGDECETKGDVLDAIDSPCCNSMSSLERLDGHDILRLTHLATCPMHFECRRPLPEETQWHGTPLSISAESSSTSRASSIEIMD